MPIRLMLLGFALFAAGCLALLMPPGARGASAGSSVKIVAKGGYGSGVHIGGGFILTASHVVGDGSRVEIKTDRGEQIPADALWTNPAYDLSLLWARDAAVLKQSRLSCSDPKVGDTITIVGNPLGLEFIHAYGRVAGRAEARPPWHRAFVGDITNIFGMSGAGVFNAVGEVVGISVGVSVAALPFSGQFIPSLNGLAYIVPGSDACRLMGRS